MDRVIHAVAPDAATIVFVEHDMEIVSRYADRVVAFYQGRILADGEPADVLKDQEVRRYVTGRRAMNAAPPLLEIDNLVVEIQSMPALRGFSMRVAQGRHGEPGRPQRRRQDHADALDHGTSQACARRRPVRRRRSVGAPAPCPRRARNRLHAGRSLPGAATDRGRKYPAAAVGRRSISTARRGSTSSTR